MMITQYYVKNMSHTIPRQNFLQGYDYDNPQSFDHCSVLYQKLK